MLALFVLPGHLFCACRRKVVALPAHLIYIRSLVRAENDKPVMHKDTCRSMHGDTFYRPTSVERERQLKARSLTKETAAASTALPSSVAPAPVVPGSGLAGTATRRTKRTSLASTVNSNPYASYMTGTGEW